MITKSEWDKRHKNISILQQDKERCYLCGEPAGYYDPLVMHHIFGGCKAIRDKSEKYGLVVYIHNSKCHIYGKNAVHVNAEINRALQAKAQRAVMKKQGWSVEDFRREFYKSYI